MNEWQRHRKTQTHTHTQAKVADQRCLMRAKEPELEGGIHPQVRSS